MIGPTHGRLTREHEAGRAAPAPTVRRVPAPVGADPVAVGRRLRSLPPAERAAETRRLQRAYGNRWVERATAPRPLPPEVRARMEGTFGSDLGDVVVGEGPEAEAMDVVAFTSGSRIVFHPGGYDPHTAEGREVLGHELAHVLQQRAGRVGGTGVNEDVELEAEADRAGERAARGERVDLDVGPAADTPPAGAVAQPMRWPFGRRRRETGAPQPSQPPVTAPQQAPPPEPERPPDRDPEHMVLQRKAEAAMKAAIVAGNRGDEAGKLAKFREYDAAMQEISDLWHYRRGGTPAEVRKVPSITGEHDIGQPPSARRDTTPTGSAESEKNYSLAPNFDAPTEVPAAQESPYQQTPAAPEPPYMQTPAGPAASPARVEAHPLLRWAVNDATGTVTQAMADAEPGRAAGVLAVFGEELKAIVEKANNQIAENKEQLRHIVEANEAEIKRLVESYAR